MGICIWQRGYVCRCTDRAGGTTCPATPNPEAAAGLQPEPQLAPAQGQLFNFISSAIATPEAIERRRAVLRGRGLTETEAAGKLQTKAAKGGRQQFITSFAVCGCHFGPDCLVQGKGGRLKLRRDARVAPQALRGLQSAAMTLATQSATPVPVDEAVLDDETAASPLENTRLLLAEREAERRALLTELRQASRRETEAEYAHVDRAPGIGHEILRLRRALHDVPDDQFPWTYTAMSDLMKEHKTPQCLSMMTAATMRDHHDSRGAHTVDITARPGTAAATSLERRVCYVTCLYIFAGTTCDVPMREILSSLRTEAKDTRELTTGRLGITKSKRQRQRDDKHALDCYAATQYEQWRRAAVQYVDGALRFLTTVVWDDDYMR